MIGAASTHRYAATVERGLRTASALGLALALLVAFTPALALEGASPTIIVPPGDERSYRYLRLENGLRVLLISDPSTDKAAASLDVNIGHSSNPPAREGLAHFLEHLLFLGTDKYPDPGEYRSFIAAHGGSNNAYTSFEHTNYFFQLDVDYLEPALDRFSQFFISPRFDAAYVERERQVVHSEYTSKIASDARRLRHARGRVLNPKHPAARFAVGNQATLADRGDGSIRDELIEFYHRTYSAELMTLVVLGAQSLPVLERFTRERFAAVRKTAAPPPVITEPLFLAETLPARINIVPVRDHRALTFVFPIPPVREHFRSKPTYLISHLLGHEGEGSLLSALKRRGWAEGLSAGLGYEHANAATFQVSVQLTPAGLNDVEATGRAMFSYLALIAEQGIERWRYEELSRLNEIRFRFEEQIVPIAYVRSLANDLHEMPPRDVVRGRYLLEEFDAELIASYLGFLRPDNVLVSLTAKGLPTDATTDWYGVEYSLERLAPQTIAAWSAPGVDPDLRLAESNAFIPEDLALRRTDDATDRPVRIRDYDGFELWHQQDTTFGLPRTDFYVSFRSPLANRSPRHSTLTRLYVALVNDQLTEFAYPAAVAGLDYSFYPHLRGMTIRLSGYSDNEEVLLGRIIDTLVDAQIHRDRFERIKEEFARSWRNREQGAPASRGIGEARHLLLDPHWSAAQRLDALDTITLDELKAYIPRLLEALDVVALAHGNLRPERALALGAMVERRLVRDAKPVQVPSPRVVKLEPGGSYLRRIDNPQPDAATVVYYQGSEQHIAERAGIGLLSQIIAPKFFDELRTERQLGYVVYASAMPIMEVPGMTFVVQSPSVSVAELERHIDEFLSRFSSQIDGLAPAALEQHKRSLVTLILERESHLRERTNRYWSELDRGYYEFDWQDRLADAVGSLGVGDVQRLFRKLLLGEERRRLVVQAPGKDAIDLDSDHGAWPDASVIHDPLEFKRSKPRFPG